MCHYYYSGVPDPVSRGAVDAVTDSNDEFGAIDEQIIAAPILDQINGMLTTQQAHAREWNGSIQETIPIWQQILDSIDEKYSTLSEASPP